MNLQMVMTIQLYLYIPVSHKMSLQGCLGSSLGIVCSPCMEVLRSSLGLIPAHGPMLQASKSSKNNLMKKNVLVGLKLAQALQEDKKTFPETLGDDEREHFFERSTIHLKSIFFLSYSCLSRPPLPWTVMCEWFVCWSPCCWTAVAWLWSVVCWELPMACTPSPLWQQRWEPFRPCLAQMIVDLHHSNLWLG